jgi:hypothetical protein
MESMMSAEYEAVRVSIKCGHFLSGYEYLIFIFSNTHSRKQYHTHTHLHGDILQGRFTPNYMRQFISFISYKCISAFFMWRIVFNGNISWGQCYLYLVGNLLCA